MIEATTEELLETIQQLESELIGTTERELKLMTQVEILTEALEDITKSRYGAQGYIEEADLKGQCNYWAILSIEYQDIARKALKSIRLLET